MRQKRAKPQSVSTASDETLTITTIKNRRMAYLRTKADIFKIEYIGPAFGLSIY